MWARLRAIFRAIFGWMIRSAEDPELLLTQYMDDLRAKVPQMNNRVAQVVAGEKEIEIRVQRTKDLIANLQPKAEAAVKLGPEQKEAAMVIITQLQQAQVDLQAGQEQLGRAQQMSKQAMEARAAYVRQVEQKITEAKAQIGRAKRAQIEQQMAQLMTSFQVGDESDTLDRMTEKIDHAEATAKARVEVAQTSVGAQMAAVETAATNTAAEDAYREMQRQLGLVPDEPTERTMTAIPLAEGQPSEGEESKTQPLHVEGKN